MRPLTKVIELQEGVKVEMLFTPHLYSFKGTQGVTLEFDKGNDRTLYETYADIMFLAALNAFVLDGHGSAEEFSYTRGDFHIWMQTHPREFGALIVFIIESLTGKTITEVLKENKVSEAKEDNGSKKKIWAKIGLKSRSSS